jgi:hypothetical protein
MPTPWDLRLCSTFTSYNFKQSTYRQGFKELGASFPPEELSNKGLWEHFLGKRAEWPPEAAAYHVRMLVTLSPFPSLYSNIQCCYTTPRHL